MIFNSNLTGRRWACASRIFLLAAALLGAQEMQADLPNARTRDYDLQNVRTHLWFNTSKKLVRGEVIETMAMLREGLTEIKMDSSGLKIQSVTLDGKEAKFATPPDQLVVSLARPAKRGERHEVRISYEGTPKKGLYFIVPDKYYPNRPLEVWTQGESEDTHYYIPIYDYPNDRTTSEMLLTVPASWITVSNGSLVGVKTEPDGMKTWDWKQTETLSTYLITAVAGEFVERRDTWRGVPLRYVVPKGSEDRIDSTLADTRGMLDAFSDRLGVKYPWAQYAQVFVDGFVVGGMENTSATTLTARSLVDPKLASESLFRADDLLSHELAHQWFGDLVTCKDWADIWLNEGFATYFQHYWREVRLGADQVAYDFWQDQNGWFRQQQLYKLPMVTRDSADVFEGAGNVYTKGGWVLKMLRSELGDENFFAALHHYLEANRGQNVVTPDLQKAIEQATAINVDKFFHQWADRAGAPKFDVAYEYDAAEHEAKLTVKQTQKVEGLVPLFDVSMEVEIATASGRKTFPIEVSKVEETFSFPAESAPLMVVFDRGDRVLKSTTFKRDVAMLSYQLKNGATVPDRAEAAAALGEFKDSAEAVAALRDAAQHDPFWGVRAEALRALGKVGGAAAEVPVKGAVGDEQPWLRQVAVEQLGKFKEDASLGTTLAEIAANDKAYRVRAAALRALSELKSANAFDTIAAASQSDSPDDTLRSAALGALGELGDKRAVSLLLEWAAPGKALETRSAAISALATLDKGNKDITRALIAYTAEPYIEVQFPAIFALGRRGDPDAITPLEEIIKRGDLSIGMNSFVMGQIAAIKAQAGEKGADTEKEAVAAGSQEALLDHMKRLEQQMEEVIARLTKLESQMNGPKK